MSESPLAQRLAIWSDQLLDVTLRNPLLSLRNNAGLPVWSDPWEVLTTLARERSRLSEEERDGGGEVIRASARAQGIHTMVPKGSPKREAGAAASWPNGLLVVPYPITLLGTTGALEAWSGPEWIRDLQPDAPMGTWLYQGNSDASPAKETEAPSEQGDAPAGSGHPPAADRREADDNDGEDDDNEDLMEGENSSPQIRSGSASARRRARGQVDEANRQRIIQHAERLTADAGSRKKVLQRLEDWAGTSRAIVTVDEGSAWTAATTARPRATRGGAHERTRMVLAVDGSPETLQNHLTRLDRVCRQKEEDHGIHTLFLACGLVQWMDTTGAARVAPLILVPVRLVRADAHSPWGIEPHSDKPRINPSLKHLLATKNQIDLEHVQKALDDLLEQTAGPNTRDAQEPTGNQIAETARRAFQNGTGAKVALLDEGRLVVASYARHALWADLQERRNAVAQHSLVQCLAGDTARTALSMPEDDEQTRRAWVEGDNLALPLPADASQRAAVARAADARTDAMVIQGPPGTGKSQTIANLIAHLMYQGRTVLFVSEKLTALDVVHQRLIEAGLGAFCLELHTRSEQSQHLAQRLSDLLERARRSNPMGGSGNPFGRQDAPGGRVDPSSRPAVSGEESSIRLNNRAALLDRSVSFLHSISPEERDSLFALIGRWMEGHVRWDVPEIPHRRDRRSIGAGPMGGQVEARPNSSVLHSDGRAAWRAWTGEQDEGIERAEGVFCVLEQQQMEPGRDFGPRLRAGQNGRNLLERWASAYGSVGPDILRRLGEGDARVLELAQDIQRARAFPADWITAWIQAGRTSPERELWDALDAWIGARADWDKQWAPWSKVFSQRVVTATDEVWTAWTEAHQGLGQWFRRRAWRKAVQQWEKPNTTWADWTRWSWERTTVRKVYEAVRQAGARLEQQAQVCKVAAPGRGRGRVDTATLIAMAAWGGATGTTLQTIPGGQEMAEAFWHGNNDLIQPDGSSLMEAYAAVQPWLAAVRPTDVQQFIDRIDQSVRRKWSGVEQKTDGGRGGSPQGDMASTVWQNSARLMYLAEEVDLHQEDLDRRRTWRNAIQQEDAQVLMDWWANHTEQSRANLRLRVDEIWSAWQAGLRAQNILMEHEELARALGVERDSLITLYRDILAGEDARARQEVVDGLLIRARAAIGSPEAAILAREALRRRPTGARSLLRQLPTLAPALLPCMMMSPLSAAEYLPSEWRFDVVIFDEASQISVGDAIGAVARGQTVIVVGDDKQMPPTSIFAGNAADTTSILDECLAAGVPKSVLTWHYRSQQERLIAFSNSTYYHGELMTFPDTRVGRGDGETNDQVTANPLDDLSESEGPAAPAPTSDIGTGRPGDPFEEIGGSGGAESSESMGAPRQDIGIEAPCVGEVVLGGGGLYVQEINGLYDRGGAGTNHEEALAIVRALTRHLEEGTQETIGVITFNRKQQNLIEDLWDRLLVEQPHLESLAGGLEKPITVRNLENAQGDERDVVLFSTTFGRDARGRFPMTFGPLGQPGGERRLNVAITRAKRRLVVYTSFRPQDIDLSRVSGQGVRDLRAWLAFARGEHEAVLIPAHNTDGQVDSPFERAVRTALERLGWTVHGQVGCSGYRIDLAVVDPNNPQRYLAGVECDGATYHSIKSARDRDVLRTQILENRGWRIQRVWSTHWFRRPEAALEDLHRQLLALRDRPAA